MQVTLLCNAGLLVEHNAEALFVDLPNSELEPFCRLSDDLWEAILCRKEPYNNVAGFIFTHDHPDHYDGIRFREYLRRYPQTKWFMPVTDTCDGKLEFGCFEVEIHRTEHAPIPNAPAHVALVIKAGAERIYFAADSDLNCERHREILDGRKMDLAVWNSMYLSREETRILMKEAAERNYICHMPDKPDLYGLWKKCEKNLQRYKAELETVYVCSDYPAILK